MGRQSKKLIKTIPVSQIRTVFDFVSKILNWRYKIATKARIIVTYQIILVPPGTIGSTIAIRSFCSYIRNIVGALW